MIGIVELLKPGPRNVSVNLCGRDICMAQHHLDASEVRSVLQQMRGKGMAEDMRRDVDRDTGLPGIPDDVHPEELTGHRPSPVREKEVSIAVFLEGRAAALNVFEHGLLCRIAERDD